PAHSAACGAAWPAFRGGDRRAAPPHYQVPRLKAAYFAPNFDTPRQRFVPENQVIRSRRRAAVFEGTDLPVRATETYLAHSEQHVGSTLELGLGYVDQLKLFLGRKYRQSLHGVTSKTLRAVGWPRCSGYCLGVQAAMPIGMATLFTGESGASPFKTRTASSDANLRTI